MAYLKIISDGKIVGIGTDNIFRRHQTTNNVLSVADSRTAQFVQIGEELYRDSWFQPIEVEYFEWHEGRVLAIEEDEYRSLIEAFKTAESIEVQEEEPPVEQVAVPDEIAETENEEITAEYVREIKLKEMSLACNKAITEGFGIELSDGEQHHFSMTLQDQANLNAASMQILNGDSEVPYHADGEEYRNFSSEDMISVIGAANAHKMRNLAYFGCLKEWLNSLVRVKSLQAVEYGSEIPKKYQSALYKSLCAG